MKKSPKIATLGQVFTPQGIVDSMLGLVKTNGRFLEPSCGDGAFLERLSLDSVGLEIDSDIAHARALCMDFFDYPLEEKFDCIIGNPPYVRFQDILESTKARLASYGDLFDSRTNLYLFFIYKSLLHLKEGGELIFITPRDFIKSTASRRLNALLYDLGSITDFIDLGDKKIFNSAQPNCAIWRFEKANFNRLSNGKIFTFSKGQLSFIPRATSSNNLLIFNSLFFVKVGAVSGADEIFKHKDFGTTEFVDSKTASTLETTRMIYGPDSKNLAYLQAFKPRLLQRKIKKFSEKNWWEWGRGYHESLLPRIYVNTKTRNKRPFFLHDCLAYSGSVLAIFPRFKVDSKNLRRLCDGLNEVDWDGLNFVCDGRFLFSQRSLETCILDSGFSRLVASLKIY